MPPLPPEAPKPDFLLIGAQKAGTTSLFFDLRAQPSIFIPDDKELRSLLNEDDDEVAAAYAEEFRDAPAGCLRGDCSTDYSMRLEYPGVPERARRVLGTDLRMIYMLRDPVQRLLSHHHHVCNLGRSLPLEEALDAWPRLIDNSRYARQLLAWDALYPAEQMLVIFFEDFVRDRVEAVRRCCDFLGVPFRADLVGEKTHNQSSGKPRADASVQRLKDCNLYRRLLRPLVPLELRLKIVHWMSPKAPPRPTEAPRELLERIRGELRDDAVRLRERLGGPPPWGE